MNKLFAFFLLVFLSPLFLIVSLIIFLELGRPLFLKQERSGIKGTKINLIKFRTMKGKDRAILDSTDFYSRTTFLTRLLRRMKLDEIPQLLNIMEGSLNFIGPRSLPFSYINENALPEKYWGIRSSVKPGITGLAQTLEYDHRYPRRRMAADIIYVRKKKVGV